MKIFLSSSYEAKVQGELLGYVGENNSRKIQLYGYETEGASRYELIFSYFDEAQYEVDITSGEYTIPASVLREPGTVDIQVVALTPSGEFIKKSNIVKGVIEESVNGESQPIPPYEDVEDMYEQILESAENAVEASRSAQESAEAADISKTEAEAARDVAVAKSQEIAGSAAQIKQNAEDISKLSESITGIERDIYGNEQSYTIIDTNTGIDNFDSARNTGTARANLFPPTSGVTAVEINLAINAQVEIGIVDITNNSHSIIVPMSIYNAGKTVIRLESAVDTTDTLKIYVNAIHGLMYVATGGVGMFDICANKKYTGWELSYALLVEKPAVKGIKQNINDIEAKINTISGINTELRYGEIIIPSTIHIAVGRECNLWWDAIAVYNRGDKSVYFECETDFGGVYENCFRVTPKQADVGNHIIRIVSRRIISREIISDITSEIVVTDTSVDSGVSKSILMMGDSRTWQSFEGENGTGYAHTGHGDKDITTEVYSLCSSDAGFNIKCVGDEVSTKNENIKNLAISGKKYNYPTGIFKNSGGIIAYCEGNGLIANERLDVATIMFGVNDLMGWDDQIIGYYDGCINKIPSIVNNAKTLIDTILDGYPTCKIILVIEPTTCASQDGFPNLSANFDRFCGMELETAMKALRKEIIKSFDNGTYSDNVVLSSAGLWCDRLYGYPYDMTPVSNRSKAKKEMWCNNVHPHTDGYKQIADGIYSTIKAIYAN